MNVGKKNHTEMPPATKTEAEILWKRILEFDGAQ
jgi:hypothetical protein